MTCLVRKENVAPPSLEERGPIPCYHLTRKVDIVERKLSCGTTCISMECSCKMQKKVKGPCRHIYAILDEAPVAEHFGLEVFKDYEAFYGVDVEYTKKVDVFIKDVSTYGGALLLRTTLFDFKKKMKAESVDKTKDWYLELLNPLGEDVNPFQKLKANDDAMKVEDALVKEDSSGEKRRRIGTLSKDGGKKRHTSSLAMITERKNQSAYTRCVSLFEEAAQACNSEEDIQDLVDVLNHFRSMKITKNCTNTARQPHGQIMSLPEQETKKNVPRKKPMLSPSKLK